MGMKRPETGSPADGGIWRDSLSHAMRRTAAVVTQPAASLRWMLRYATYLWRLMVRGHATPHQIALGCAIGVFAACTPLFGIQMLMAASLAYVARANIPAALIATFVGNPFSWPAIWGASYMAGTFVLGLDPAFAADHVKGTAIAISQSLKDPSSANIDAAVITLSPLFMPMAIGSFIVGLVAAAAAYYPTARAVRMLQDRRAAA